jgi:hypothetical protein
VNHDEILFKYNHLSGQNEYVLIDKVNLIFTKDDFSFSVTLKGALEMNK